ncbi:MAG: hypothetical protein JOZ09_14540 [Pseudonocardiales bacterium]|nr:hypothetical protein [Pseudonocardiales bacterium]
MKLEPAPRLALEPAPPPCASQPTRPLAEVRRRGWCGHGFATGADPLLKNLDSRTFTRTLSWGEVTLGTALPLPLVPTGLAGVGL